MTGADCKQRLQIIQWFYSKEDIFLLNTYYFDTSIETDGN